VAKNVDMRSTPSSFGHDHDAAGSGERVRVLRARARRPNRGLPMVVLLACAVFASVAVLALNS
jgi:hypothetical protein